MAVVGPTRHSRVSMSLVQGNGHQGAILTAAQPYYHPQHANNVQDIQPDRPIGYGAFGVVWQMICEDLGNPSFYELRFSMCYTMNLPPYPHSLEFVAIHFLIRLPRSISAETDTAVLQRKGYETMENEVEEACELVSEAEAILNREMVPCML